MNILFVDDDKEDVSLFSELVYEIVPDAVCNSFNDCINIAGNIGRLPIQDIIFLDAHMAPVSGKECMMKLKEVIDPQKTRVIILTGSISELEEHEFLGLGVAAVILKGTSVQEIKSTLLHAISGNTQQSA